MDVMLGKPSQWRKIRQNGDLKLERSYLCGRFQIFDTSCNERETNTLAYHEISLQGVNVPINLKNCTTITAKASGRLCFLKHQNVSINRYFIRVRCSQYILSLVTKLDGGLLFQNNSLISATTYKVMKWIQHRRRLWYLINASPRSFESSLSLRVHAPMMRGINCDDGRSRLEVGIMKKSSFAWFAFVLLEIRRNESMHSSFLNYLIDSFVYFYFLYFYIKKYTSMEII
jgi:hypothetical protein